MEKVITPKDGESASKPIIDTPDGLILVESVFDLIEVTLRDKEKYKVINQPYWIRNSKGEFEKYEMYHHFEGDDEPTLVRVWRSLEVFVNNKMMYINGN